MLLMMFADLYFACFSEALLLLGLCPASTRLGKLESY